MEGYIGVAPGRSTCFHLSIICITVMPHGKLLSPHFTCVRFYHTFSPVCAIRTGQSLASFSLHRLSLLDLVVQELNPDKELILGWDIRTRTLTTTAKVLCAAITPYPKTYFLITSLTDSFSLAFTLSNSEIEYIFLLP